MSKKKPALFSEAQFNSKKLSSLGLIIILGIFISSLFLSYLNFYPSFLDKKIIYSLDSFVATLPLLPKTPKQIVTKALATADNLQSYSFKVTGSVQNAKISLLDFSTTGSVEKAAQTSGKVHLQTKINSPLIGEADFETFEDQDSFFFKVIKAPSLKGFDFSTITKNNWSRVNLNNFQKNLGANSRSDKEIVSDIRTEINKVRNEIINSKSFPAVKEFKEVSQSGEKYYQVKLSLNNLTIKDTFLGKEFDTKKTSIELLINKTTFFITKVSLSNTSDGFAKDAATQFNYEISKINQRQEFPNVSVLKTLKSPLDIYSLINPNTDLSGANFFTSATDSSELGSNFLTLERLLKVLSLLPKAF